MRQRDLPLTAHRRVQLRLSSAWAEAVRGSVVSSVATSIITALVCGVVIALAGQTRLTQERIDATLADASSRLVRVRDVDGSAGLDRRTVASLQQIEEIAWVVGFTGIRDVGKQVFDGDAYTTPAVGALGDIDRLYPGATSRLEPGDGRAMAGRAAIASLGLPRPGLAVSDSMTGLRWASSDPRTRRTTHRSGSGWSCTRLRRTTT